MLKPLNDSLRLTSLKELISWLNTQSLSGSLIHMLACSPVSSPSQHVGDDWTWYTVCDITQIQEITPEIRSRHGRYITSPDVTVLFWWGIGRIGPMSSVVNVHVIFIRTETLNKITKRVKRKQYSSVKHRHRKQLPTNHIGKTGCLSMVLNQRQRSTAASLIGNHTRPNTEIQNIEHTT
jgi:hypothetical protein